jgi:putative peptidoglycan lipid II flippase
MQSAAPAKPSRTGEPGLARAAGILGLGNVASRVLGLVRETVISSYFGASGELSAFRLAARVPTIIYDLLVGGMLSAALVPVFSDYARPERRHELARVASAIFSLLAILMGLLMLLLELFAEPAAALLGNFTDARLQGIIVGALRLIAPAILLFGISGGVTGLLYSLKRFNYTALSGAVFNLGIVICAPLLANHIGIYALPLGIVLGSMLQLGVMMPGLRDLKLRFTLVWDHPGVRRILRLYVPIAFGLVITEIQIIIDGRWASGTGPQSVSWMGYATTLIQLPLGLVPMAVSLAALPTLSQHAAAGAWTEFRGVFAGGLRLVVVLLLPVVVGLLVLAEPVVRVLFEHRSFLPADTLMTAQALRVYLIGLPFAGIDFMLNYTFYARQDTRTPAIVGVIAVGGYFVAALALLPLWGFLGLVMADSIKQAVHALIMSLLLYQSVGRLEGYAVFSTAGRCLLASIAMGALAWGLSLALAPVASRGFLGEVTQLGVAAGVGGLVYLALLRVFHVAEVERIFGLVRSHLPRRA